VTLGERRYRSFHLPESRPHFARSKAFHTEHLKLEIEVDLQRKRLEGRASLRIIPLRSLQRIELDARAMQISAVTLDGRACRYEYDNEKLIAIADSPLTKGEHEIVLSYSTSPTQGVYFIQPDEAYPDKEVQAWTQSETEFASYWVPCYDFPNDMSTSELLITVREGFLAISNGKLLSAAKNGDKVTYHWKEETPHSTYLNSFVVGKFGVKKEEVGGISLEYYFPEGRRNDVARYFGETAKMMKVFGELTGIKYPYSKYAQTTVEDFIYGGMENISATTLTTTNYHDERSDEDFQVSYSREGSNAVNLVAHELAHQWFGDLVTCADWSHAWLNEGFASYFQCLYLEKEKGVDILRRDMSLKAELYFDEDESSYRRPIVERNYVYPDDLFDSTTYEKGAWMIHQLRYILGDDSFFRGVREYLKQFSRENAETHDLRKALERVSGESLEEYFEEFFFKAGYPEFELEYAWDEVGSTANLSVRQRQQTDDQTPIFRLPCDIVFYTQKGRTKKRVLLSSAEEKLTFELGSKPRIVEFDPEEWILKKVKFRKSFELLANQLRGSIDASSRARAAADLGFTKNNAVLAPLKEAAMTDPSWIVRARALEALGEVGTEEALTSILSLGIPENRRVRRALAKALANFKGQGGYKLLEEFLLRDESPYVQCEAAISLAKAHASEALQLLKKAMKINSPNFTLTEACLDAAGYIKEEEVRTLIGENLRYGVPSRARIGAMKGIINRGYAYEDEVATLKEILLRDKEFRVRYYVADQVAPRLAERRMLEELKRASVSDQDTRVRRRALEAYYELLRTAETISSIAKLGEEVEGLKKENRELRERLSGLERPTGP
jgi:aminopeptidase N